MKWLWLRNFALLGFPFLISAAIAKPTHKKPAWEKTTEKDHDPLSEIEPFLSVAPIYVGMDDLSMSSWEKGDLYQKANKKYPKRHVTPWHEGYWLNKHYLHMADKRFDPCSPFYPRQIPGTHPYTQPHPPMGRAGTRSLVLNRAKNHSPYSQRIPVQRPRGYPNRLCQPSQPPGGLPQTPGGRPHPPGVDPRVHHNPHNFPGHQPYPQSNHRPGPPGSNPWHQAYPQIKSPHRQMNPWRFLMMYPW